MKNRIFFHQDSKYTKVGHLKPEKLETATRIKVYCCYTGSRVTVEKLSRENTVKFGSGEF